LPAIVVMTPGTYVAVADGVREDDAVHEAVAVAVALEPEAVRAHTASIPTAHAHAQKQRAILNFAGELEMAHAIELPRSAEKSVQDDWRVQQTGSSWADRKVRA
jgi:hypothetical protein